MQLLTTAAVLTADKKMEGDKIVEGDVKQLVAHFFAMMLLGLSSLNININ